MSTLLLILVFVAGFFLVTRWTDKRGWTSFRGNGRGMMMSALNPWEQAFDPRRKEAQAYVEQMETGHEQEADGQGDEPPEAEPEESMEQQIHRQMGSAEGYLKRRGARGKQPDSGARV
jgi:hypothetical protein